MVLACVVGMILSLIFYIFDKMEAYKMINKSN